MILLHHKFYFCLSQCPSGCHILADSRTAAEITTLLNKIGSYFYKTKFYLRLCDVTYYYQTGNDLLYRVPCWNKCFTEPCGKVHNEKKNVTTQNND
jgi:hypothetical protein